MLLRRLVLPEQGRTSSRPRRLTLFALNGNPTPNNRIPNLRVKLEYASLRARTKTQGVSDRNSMRENEAGKSYLRESFALAALLVVVVLHFFFTQFVALESENDAAVSVIIVKPDVDVRLIDEEKKAELALPAPQEVSVRRVVASEKAGAEKSGKIIKTREAVVKPAPVKKQEAQDETKSKRLRRAEKLLTGF